MKRWNRYQMTIYEFQIKKLLLYGSEKLMLALITYKFIQKKIMIYGRISSSSSFLQISHWIYFCFASSCIIISSIEPDPVFIVQRWFDLNNQNSKSIVSIKIEFFCKMTKFKYVKLSIFFQPIDIIFIMVSKPKTNIFSPHNFGWNLFISYVSCDFPPFTMYFVDGRFVSVSRPCLSVCICIIFKSNCTNNGAYVYKVVKTRRSYFIFFLLNKYLINKIT